MKGYTSTFYDAHNTILHYIDLDKSGSFYNKYYRLRSFSDSIPTHKVWQ